MTNNRYPENLLTTWKEIASFLHVDIRTCRRWEEHMGMPVHRFSKSKKSRVFAYKNELEEWLNNESGKSIPKKKLITPSNQRREFYLIVIISIFIVAFLASKYIITLNKPIEPADFKIQGSYLTILDEKGRELWRYDTGNDGLLDNNPYKMHFQKKREREGDREFPYIVIKDINGDGSPEVLFSIQTQTEFGEGDLLCFNNRGDLMWSFKTGRELKFGQKVYSANYRIHGFDVYDLNKDNKLEIIVISDHLPDFPTQLVILNSEGKKLGEYWNSGRLVDYLCVDLNNDTNSELVVTGTNNEYCKPCLIVFDTNRIEGSSPQLKSFYRCENLKAGRELYYILFPKVDLVALEALMESISRIDVLENKRLFAVAGISNIIYELDFDLKLKDIRLTHGFQIKLKKAISDGKIENKRENATIIYRLKQELLYFNGEDWVSEATLPSYWKK